MTGEELRAIEEKVVALKNEVDALKRLQVPAVEGRVKQVHDYAWAWFSYHAGQRTGVFNFFLAAAALLFTGFGAAASEGNRLLAELIAAIGVAVSVSFCLIDRRNEELVEHAKTVLKETEKSLFALDPPLAGPAAQGVVGQDPERKGWDAIVHGRHRWHFRLLEGAVGGVFLFALLALFFGKGWEYDLAREKPDSLGAIASAVASAAESAGSVARSVAKLDHAVRAADFGAAARIRSALPLPSASPVPASSR